MHDVVLLSPSAKRRLNSTATSATAPKEFAQLSTRISRTRSRIDVELQLHQRLSGGSLDTLLSNEALKVLQTDLIDATSCLNQMRDLVSTKSAHPEGRERFVWVIRDKRKVLQVLQNLRDIDHNLSALLATLSL
ncbi:MAG: hypothetical protein Q9173_001252 [Seirophora scorigena]